MSKHTPAPWRVVVGEGSTGESIVSVVDLTDSEICSNERYYPAPLNPDNAFLIAAAPELLSTLELVKRRLNTCLCDEVEMGEGTMNRLFEEVSEAISLAKGEKE